MVQRSRYRADFVEEGGLRSRLGADPLLGGLARSNGDDGVPRQVAQGALFYEFSLEAHVPAGPSACAGSIGSSSCPASAATSRRFYSAIGRPSIDPRADDPYAARRLRHGRPVGAAALRRGPI